MRLSARMSNFLLVFFSWPSVCSAVQGYFSDRDIIECSEEPLFHLLTDIMEHCDELDIIAHSMGNKLLVRAIERLFHM